MVSCHLPRISRVFVVFCSLFPRLYGFCHLTSGISERDGGGGSTSEDPWPKSSLMKTTNSFPGHRKVKPQEGYLEAWNKQAEVLRELQRILLCWLEKDQKKVLCIYIWRWPIQRPPMSTVRLSKKADTGNSHRDLNSSEADSSELACKVLSSPYIHRKRKYCLSRFSQWRHPYSTQIFIYESATVLSKVILFQAVLILKDLEGWHYA